VVVQDSPSAAEAQRVVGEEIRTRSLKVAGTARVGMNGEGAAGEALRLAKLKPGFVMIVADTIGTALFLKEFRKHDAQVFVAGTSLTNLDTLKELAGPKSLEWTVFSQVVPNPGAGTSPLQIEHLNMMRKYRDEAVSTLTLEGFAAAKAFALLVQQSRARSLTLASLLARGGTMDTGGLAITPGSHGSLSAYIDIALFRKGSGLMF